MGLYDVGQNFTPGTGTSFNARGAYNFKPAEGSSNILGGGISSTPTAGAYMGLPGFDIFNNPAYKNLSEQDKNRYMQYYGPSPDRDIVNKLLDPQAQAATRKQQLEDAAAFYKTQGDQQMKYNLVNRGLTALQTGLERGLTKYQDPYTIANMMANGYAEGARSSSGLAQIGAGIPSRQYYNV